MQTGVRLHVVERHVRAPDPAEGDPSADIVRAPENMTPGSFGVIRISGIFGS